MSEIKNGGLDQFGAGPFEQQQFGTAGVEGVNLFVHLSFYFRQQGHKEQQNYNNANYPISNKTCAVGYRPSSPVL